LPLLFEAHATLAPAEPDRMQAGAIARSLAQVGFSAPPELSPSPKPNLEGA
jgi:hypothetical protein